ncbi:MAG: hypothetical protein K5765_05680 [Clostridia bacterium]|nr:hypothetical protein [Clostridia bacterium]
MEIIENLDRTLKEGELSVFCDFGSHLISFVLTDGKKVLNTKSTINPVMEIGGTVGFSKLYMNKQFEEIVSTFNKPFINVLKELIKESPSTIKMLNISCLKMYNTILETILRMNEIEIETVLFLPNDIIFSPSFLMKCILNPFNSIVIDNSDNFLICKDKGGEVICGALYGLRKDYFGNICRRAALQLFIKKGENNHQIIIYGEHDHPFINYLKYKQYKYEEKSNSIIELIRIPYDKQYFSQLLDVEKNIRHVQIAENDFFQEYISRYIK